MKAPVQLSAYEKRLQRALRHSSASIPRVAPAKVEAAPRADQTAVLPAAPKARARVVATRRDGTPVKTFPLSRAEQRIGSDLRQADLLLPGDDAVAPAHALVRFEQKKLVVEPLPQAASGVFIAVKARPLRPDDELMVGRQRVRVEWVASAHDAHGEPRPGAAGRFLARAVLLEDDGAFGDSFLLKRGDNLLGLGPCEVVFPSSAVVSQRHAVINVTPGQLAVRDLKSASGTFVRLTGRTSIRFGDQLLIGDHLLKFEKP